MKKMLGLILCLCLFVSGCATTYVGAGLARSRLNKLEIGMTKDEVLETMGEPYKREVYPEVEYLFYVTESPIIMGKPHWNDLTPVRFKNGKLEGWGQSYWEPREEKIGADITFKNKQ